MFLDYVFTYIKTMKELHLVMIGQKLWIKIY